ncbi:MAG: 7-carboxy-7-deazaguanine synthase QueE [Ignavibacteria bacterium]|nr:7-carboxy-7-deazaguanine synthase QueE [Ignavibacteria bacterium]
MKISELFYSIQGEGKRAGKPSFFIRTNHCNLRCQFAGGNLCDTAYTSWNPDDGKNIGDIPIERIIGEYIKYNCMDVVITGGEPSMFTEDLNLLCSDLKRINPECVITIETNGTIFGKYVEYADLISISPKLKSSTPFATPYEKMHSNNRINIESFNQFNECKEKNIIDIQWKFVITSEEDLQEILNLQKEIGFKNEDVYLMPEGITEEELNTKRLNIIELCKKYQFNYTDRLHVIIWGNKRGV